MSIASFCGSENEKKNPNPLDSFQVRNKVCLPAWTASSSQLLLLHVTHMPQLYLEICNASRENSIAALENPVNTHRRSAVCSGELDLWGPPYWVSMLVLDFIRLVIGCWKGRLNRCRRALFQLL